VGVKRRNPNSKKPLLIGLAGGSGSGKTHLARQIKAGAGMAETGHECVSILSMDQYFIHENLEQSGRHKVNFDHPAHINFAQMIRDLKALKKGQSVWTPSYDFVEMKSQPDAIFVEARPVVIVEGLFVLSDPMHHWLDLTCYLDVAPDQRLLGRILRDIKERGTTIEEIVDRYQRFVRPAYDIFVAPTKHNADVVVDFTYRRALFAEMLTHIARDYVIGDLDGETFLANVRKETYHIGYRPEEGTMPVSVDIIKLAKAYPPSMIPHGVPEDVQESASLFIKTNHSG
jgi:uridine kinase